jgi:hypothetical protein
LGDQIPLEICWVGGVTERWWLESESVRSAMDDRRELRVREIRESESQRNPFLLLIAPYRERKLKRGGEYRLSAMEDKWGLWCRLRGCPLAVHVSEMRRFDVWPELLFDVFFPFSGSVISTRAVLRSARDASVWNLQV